MEYIIATPANMYFFWQVAVQVHNFKKYDLDKNLIYVVADIDSYWIQKFKTFAKRNPTVRFYFYKDRRIRYNYYVSLRHNIMKQYRKDHPYHKPYMFTDPDVLFTKQPDFDHLTKDNIIYLSNTVSYIGANYIKSKSTDLFKMMCDTVNVTTKLIENIQKDSGGAQYIIKNDSYEYWDKVENDSEDLYMLMNNKVDYINDKTTKIQSWTADMWSILWNFIYFKQKVKVIPEMDFCWATDKIHKWDKKTIFHNAGVVDQSELFNKGHYSKKSPFFSELSHVSDEYCSYNYVKEIKETYQENEIIITHLFKT